MEVPTAEFEISGFFPEKWAPTVERTQPPDVLHRLTVYGIPYSSPSNTATSRYHSENQDDTIPKIAQHHHRSASSRVIPSTDRHVTLLSGPTESSREEREAREVLFSYIVSFDNEISSKRAEMESKEVRSAHTLFCFHAYARYLW